MRLPVPPATWQPFRPRPPEDQQNGSHQIPVPAAMPRQRRRGMLALGVALTGTGILAGGLLLSAAGHHDQVLAVTADIPPGATITRADLTTVSVSAPKNLKVIPASQLSQVTGEQAATGLKAGTLLTPADLTVSQLPATGDQLVTVTLKPSQLPASGLRPGDQILVIATPGSQNTPAILNASVPATVTAVAGPAQDGMDTVDVQVAAAVAPLVARQVSTGQVALIVTARRS